jgi:hypothetical protein
MADLVGGYRHAKPAAPWPDRRRQPPAFWDSVQTQARDDIDVVFGESSFDPFAQHTLINPGHDELEGEPQ